MLNIYKKILIITLLSLAISENGEFGIVPTLSATWDNNIGFNFGLGVAVGKWGEGVFTGLYSSYSFSKKGNNLSFGPYAGAGIATFRVGVNRLKLKGQDDIYWGIETTPSIIIGHLRLGILKNKNIYKPSYALGLGLF